MADSQAPGPAVSGEGVPLGEADPQWVVRPLPRPLSARRPGPRWGVATAQPGPGELPFTPVGLLGAVF